MLYHILRSLVKFCLHFYIKRMGWAGLENIPKDKPVLLCSTHSNSFLDALPVASYLGRHIYELARGDAFKKLFFLIFCMVLRCCLFTGSKTER